MKEKLIKIIDFTIEAGVLLIVFLVPLYFSFFYQTNPLFSLDKAALFKIIIEFLLILNLVKILIEKNLFFISERKYIYFPLLFFITLSLATFFSKDPHISFWGSYARQDGLFTNLHYFLFLIIIVSYLKNKKQIERIINTILIGSFLVSAYGVLQALGIEFLPWQRELISGQRVVSTMGQPVFLANYLLLVIFLSVYKLMSLRGRNEWGEKSIITPFNKGGVGGFLSWRIGNNFIFIIIYTLLLFFQTFCLIFTYTRGAWVGFIFGLFFSLILYFLLVKNNFFKNILIFLSIAAVIVSFFLFVSLKYGDSPDNLFAARIRSFADFKSGSSAMRLETWKVSIDAITKSPLIGYGPENEHDTLVKYYKSKWSVYEKINTSPDRAHNIVLDLLLNGGIILFISYAIFFFAFILFSLKKLFQEFEDRRNINWFIFFILVGIISYHISLFFSFSIIETNVFFWLFIGIIIASFNNFQQVEIINFFNFKKFYYLLFLCSAIILSGFLVHFIVFNINTLKADYFFKKARTGYYTEKYLDMFNNYATSLKLNDKEEYYQWFYVNDLVESLEKVNSDKYRESVLNHIESARLESSLKSNFSSLFVKVKLYSALGKYKDKKYFGLAESAFNELIKISPYFPDLYNLGGYIYFMEGDYNKALVIYKEALSVLPDLNNSFLNGAGYEHKWQINNFIISVYDRMIDCYNKIGDDDSRLKYYKKIISIYPYRLDVYKKIANIYYKKGDLDSAIWYNKRGYMLNLNDYAWPFAIALLYEEKGDKAKVLEYADEALKLSPESREIKLFINRLKK